MDSELSGQEKLQNIQPTQTQPIVENNTKQEYATYKTWSNPDMWKEDSK
jgi:hypothetical protein